MQIQRNGDSRRGKPWRLLRVWPNWAAIKKRAEAKAKRRMLKHPKRLTKRDG